MRNLLNAPTLSTIRVNSELLTVAFNAGVLNQRELVSYEEHRKAKTQIYIMMYEEFNQRIIDRFRKPRFFDVKIILALMMQNKLEMFILSGEMFKIQLN